MSEVHSHQNRFLTFALLMAIGFATLPAQAVTTAITGGDLTKASISPGLSATPWM